jgi:hypothetical protein
MLRVVVDSAAGMLPALRVAPALSHRGDEALRDGVAISRDARHAGLTHAAAARGSAAAAGAPALAVTVSQALMPAAQLAVLDSRSIALPIGSLAPGRLAELATAQAPLSRLDAMHSTEPDVAERPADGCAAAGLHPRAQTGLVQIGAMPAHAGPGAPAITALRSPA